MTWTEDWIGVATLLLWPVFLVGVLMRHASFNLQHLPEPISSLRTSLSPGSSLFSLVEANFVSV